ncbi:B12-binding domain-containing radical SAM protein [Myxococcota bacterium]
MDVTFLFPPQWTPDHPHYSIATLAGQLRRAGHSVRVIDLNLEFIETVLHPKSTQVALLHLESEKDLLLTEVKLRLATQDQSDKTARAAEKLKAVEKGLERWRESAQAHSENWARAADVLRDPSSFYEPEKYLAARACVDAALELFSLPYYPSDVRWNDFRHPTAPFNLEPMLAFCEDSQLNPFLRFFRERAGDILGCSTNILAISISSFSQVMAGLTLAHLLKVERGSAIHPHISLGGNFFSRLKAALKTSPGFFGAFADTVTIGEGEQPIVALANVLEAAPGDTAALGRVPSLVFLDDRGDTQDTEDAPLVSMDTLAFQDLAAFPLSRYLTPNPVVCIRASKGCYWGKCTFCDSHYGLKKDKLTIDRLIAEMQHLNREFGIRDFEFVDQCMRPDYLSTMCDTIIRAGLKVRWFCNARTEPEFDRNLLERMRQAGATMVMWGVESGSDRLLKLMRKGITPSTRLNLLRLASDVGLWNFAYIFLGFPTETEQEAMQTIDLVRHNTDVIHSYGRSVFTLGKHSPLMKDPDHYGILGWVEDDQEFSTNVTCNMAKGIQGPVLSEMSQRCLALCREAYGDPLWMMLRSRETLHLYLAERGRSFVQGWQLPASDESVESEIVF